MTINSVSYALGVFALLLPLLSGFEAQASTPKTCLSLLTQEVAAPASNRESLAAVTNWLKNNGPVKPTQEFQNYLRANGFELYELNENQREDWLAQFTLLQWNRWRNIGAIQRDQAAALELKKISPRSPEQVLRMDGGLQISALSQANIKRMLDRIQTRDPVPQAILNDTALLKKIQTAVAQISFNYVQPVPRSQVAGVSLPLPSALELSRLNIAPTYHNFYSDLVGTSSAVPFTLVTTTSNSPASELEFVAPYTAVRLNSKLAKEHGFLLPSVHNAIDLIQLFQAWEPDAVDALVKSLRFTLPSSINSADAFVEYLTLGNLDSIFPQATLYQTLAPLRTRLSHFVMTEPDGQEFLRQAMTHFLLLTASRDPSRLQSFLDSFKRSGGSYAFFMQDFAIYLGVKGYRLEIPIAVSPKDFLILRQEDDRLRLPSMTAVPGLRDFGRLDHSQAP